MTGKLLAKQAEIKGILIVPPKVDGRIYNLIHHEAVCGPASRELMRLHYLGAIENFPFEALTDMTLIIAAGEDHEFHQLKINQSFLTHY